MNHRLSFTEWVEFLNLVFFFWFGLICCRNLIKDFRSIYCHQLCGPKKPAKTKTSFCQPAGEEQLHLAADRCAEQTEGAPRAAPQEEENQKYDFDRAQRSEDGQHPRTRHGELNDTAECMTVLIQHHWTPRYTLVILTPEVFPRLFPSFLSQSLFSSFLSLLIAAPHSGGTLQCHSKWPPSNIWLPRRGQTGGPRSPPCRFVSVPLLFLSTSMLVSFSTTSVCAAQHHLLLLWLTSTNFPHRFHL